MSTTKSVEEWERDYGQVILGTKVDLSAQVSAHEFEQLRIDHGVVGVSHEDREKFLRDNGYEVNRANMVDGSLSAVPKPE